MNPITTEMNVEVNIRCTYPQCQTVPQLCHSQSSLQHKEVHVELEKKQQYEEGEDNNKYVEICVQCH